ncbi:MAG TPA: hypothetical protein VET23_02255 [Chitinophagaceae bacterium]|nr:hypothetical protein [Chitinophagaceae bacterium]
MKKISLSALLIFFTLLSQGQDNPLKERKMIDPVSGNLLYISQYEDVKGSPFYSEDWMKAIVIANNNTMFKNMQLKLDVTNNEFLFKRNDTDFLLGPEITEVRLFARNGDSIVFKNGYDINNAIRPSRYLQVLEEGKVTFLKNLKKGIEEYNEYGDATKYKHFVEQYEYYTYRDGKADPARLTKKELQSLLSDKWDKVSQFLSQNNLSGKDEKSFKAAVGYYNSL